MFSYPERLNARITLIPATDSFITAFILSIPACIYLDISDDFLNTITEIPKNIRINIRTIHISVTLVLAIRTMDTNSIIGVGITNCKTLMSVLCITATSIVVLVSSDAVENSSKSASERSFVFLISEFLSPSPNLAANSEAR